MPGDAEPPIVLVVKNDETFVRVCLLRLFRVFKLVGLAASGGWSGGQGTARPHVLVQAMSAAR